MHPWKNRGATIWGRSNQVQELIKWLFQLCGQICEFMKVLVLDDILTQECGRVLFVYFAWKCIHKFFKLLFKLHTYWYLAPPKFVNSFNYMFNINLILQPVYINSQHATFCKSSYYIVGLTVAYKILLTFFSLSIIWICYAPVAVTCQHRERRAAA